MCLDQVARLLCTATLRLLSRLECLEQNTATIHLPVCIVSASSLEYDQNQVLRCQTCHRNVHNQDWNDRTGADHGTLHTAGKAYHRNGAKKKLCTIDSLRK